MLTTNQSADNENPRSCCLSVVRLPIVFLRSVRTSPPIFPVVSHGPFVPNGFALRRSFPVLKSIFPYSAKKSTCLHYPLLPTLPSALCALCSQVGWASLPTLLDYSWG